MKERKMPIKPSIFIALGLAIGVSLWMWSGQMQPESTSLDLVSNDAKDKINPPSKTVPLIKVRVIQSIAQNHQTTIIISGKTEANKRVEISAETDGRLIFVDLEEGQPLSKGQVIAKMSIDERQAILTRAKVLLEQREIEYEAAKKLEIKGFQSKTKKAAAAAYLSAAKADQTIAQVDLNNTVIVAPFNGVVKTKYVDVGDYTQRGDPIAEIVSLNPLYVTGHVAEKEISYINLGTTAHIRLVTGQLLSGVITRIAPVANDKTRTFKIEALVDNASDNIQAGLTAELRLSLHEVRAHFITPALLSLNDAGQIGIKTVSNTGHVIFNNIKIIEDTQQGLWVAGLPDDVTLISVGQEYVIDGQQVDTQTDQRTKDNPTIGNAS